MLPMHFSAGIAWVDWVPDSAPHACDVCHCSKLVMTADGALTPHEFREVAFVCRSCYVAMHAVLCGCDEWQEAQTAVRLADENHRQAG